MVLVTIDHIEVFPLDERLAGFSLETPQTGTTSELYEIDFAGWIVARAGQTSRVQARRRLATTDVYYGVMKRPPLRAFPVDRARADVSAHHALPEDYKSGFAGTVGLVGSALTFEWILEAVLEDGTVLPLCAISGRREPLRSDFSPRRRPVLVTTLGRSGSTLVMRLLGAHRQVAVEPLYPHETRAAGYWMHALTVMSAPANHLQSSHPNSYQHDPFWLGSHPHNMPPVSDTAALRLWFGRDYSRRLAGMFMQLIEEFYERVVANDEDASPAYFAEKSHANHTSQLMSELYPDGREIFLVRDFRDMLCSMRSWYEKRGIVSFGLHHQGAADDFLLRWQYNAQVLSEAWKARRARAFLLRYEDLITNPSECAAAVFSYLGLESSDSEMTAAVTRAFRPSQDFALHQTAQSSASSIGRWKSDLTASEQNAYHSHFADVLQEFGYEL